MSQEKEPDYQFKIVVIGDTNVGKSNLITRYTMDQFSKDLKATIGVEFGVKQYKFEDGTQTRATIYDTAGQERYRSLVKSYFRGAHGALIVYDITNLESFRNVEKWVNELREFSGNPRVVIVVVGNKVDLAEPQTTSAISSTESPTEPEIDHRDRTEPDQAIPQGGLRAVSKEEAIELVQSLGADVAFMETSALTRENVDAAFDTIIREIYDRVRMNGRALDLEHNEEQAGREEEGEIPQFRKDTRMETIELDHSPRDGSAATGSRQSTPGSVPARERISSSWHKWRSDCSGLHCGK